MQDATATETQNAQKLFVEDAEVRVLCAGCWHRRDRLAYGRVPQSDPRHAEEQVISLSETRASSPQWQVKLTTSIYATQSADMTCHVSNMLKMVPCRNLAQRQAPATLANLENNRLCTCEQMLAAVLFCMSQALQHTPL